MPSTSNDVYFNRLDADPLFFHPLDRSFDLLTRTCQFKANDADFFSHTGLSHVGNDLEFLTQVVNDGVGDQFRGIHEP